MVKEMHLEICTNHFSTIYRPLKTAGEFYTPRAITNFAIEMLDPKLGESILDPAAVGTGGFLCS